MRVIGLLSGTSYDAVEVAAADLDLTGEEVTLTPLGTRSVDIPPDLRGAITGVLPPAATTIERVCQLDTGLGQLFGRAAVEGIAELAGGRCDLVVSHGQTVFHWVEGAHARGTLQLGAAAWIAEATGSAVISDLRSRDIARGGHGAPLVSILDALLILGDGQGRGSLNLGGIANVTVRRGGDVVSWDIGPANALIDAAVVELSEGAETMDRDGARAARGRVRDDLLGLLLDEPYYARPAPKSTGKELFGPRYVPDRLRRLAATGAAPVGDDDLVATVTELTAVLIGRTCRDDSLAELVMAGGGTRNPQLMHRMQRRCAPTVLRPVEDFGLPAGGKEAYLFALLGYLSAHGIPGTIPTATGARRAAVLGSVTPGAEAWQPPPPAAAPRRLVVRNNDDDGTLD